MKWFHLYWSALCVLCCFDVKHVYSCHVLLSVKRLSSEANLQCHWFMRINITEILGLPVGNVGCVHWAVLFVQRQVETYCSIPCHTLLNSVLGPFGPTRSAPGFLFPSPLDLLRHPFPASSRGLLPSAKSSFLGVSTINHPSPSASTLLNSDLQPVQSVYGQFLVPSWDEPMVTCCSGNRLGPAMRLNLSSSA